MVSTKKRFIAGAVCPKCAAMDTVVMYREGEVDHRECVACGFSDEMHFKQQARELTTRVNLTEEQKREQTQTIKILDIGNAGAAKQAKDKK